MPRRRKSAIWHTKNRELEIGKERRLMGGHGDVAQSLEACLDARLARQEL